MTPQELKRWRRDHFRPGGKREPLTQTDLGRLLGMCGCSTVQKWEYGQRAVPKWVGRFLNLVDLLNGRKRDISAQTWRIVTGDDFVTGDKF